MSKTSMMICCTFVSYSQQHYFWVLQTINTYKYLLDRFFVHSPAIPSVPSPGIFLFGLNWSDQGDLKKQNISVCRLFPYTHIYKTLTFNFNEIFLWYCDFYHAICIKENTKVNIYFLVSELACSLFSLELCVSIGKWTKIKSVCVYQAMTQNLFLFVSM